jgi:drug/metabolite transporter (DMT)-like permease
MLKERRTALIWAFIVTFLWSSSYILVKIGLTELPPLTLVAIRYVTASAILIPLAIMKREANKIKDTKTILKLAFLGVSGITIAQGLQCIGLYYLPAVSVTFILNFTPIIVLGLSAVILKERPTPSQIVGLGLVLIGAYLFFNAPLSTYNTIGIILTLSSGIAWATYLVSSRLLLTKEDLNPLAMTAFSMGFGASLLTITAFSIEHVSKISIQGWSIILWLGIVNTALAFFIWNYALQKIEAFEISILQNTMLIQIALLSWFFLNEQLTTIKLISMALVFIGVLLVQLKNLRTAS